MKLQKEPTVIASMFIRKPVEQVFEAFIDPEITTHFWFTNSTGKLEEGKQVRWDWEMYGVSAQVKVRTIQKNKRILIKWGSDESFTTVEWEFTSYDEGTFVSITQKDFNGTAEEQVAQVIDSMGGFTMVLAGLKAFLEHGIELNLVSDKVPPE